MAEGGESSGGSEARWRAYPDLEWDVRAYAAALTGYLWIQTHNPARQPGHNIGSIQTGFLHGLIH